MIMMKKAVAYSLFFLVGIALALSINYYENASTDENYLNSETMNTSTNEKALEVKNLLENSRIYYFYADWCPHCQKVKPYVTEMSKEYSITFCNLTAGENTLSDECRAIASQVNIQGIPTMLIISNGTGYMVVGEDQILELARYAGIEVKVNES